MTKNDTATIADRLDRARAEERRRALILAQRATVTARMQMRRAMDRVQRLTLQAIEQDRAARQAATAAQLVGKLDSDLVAARARITTQGPR